MTVVLIWLVFCIVVAAVASSKKRSAIGFFLLSALLSPLVGLLVVAVVPVKDTVATPKKKMRSFGLTI